jgi:hypothetical protein
MPKYRVDLQAGASFYMITTDEVPPTTMFWYMGVKAKRIRLVTKVED